MINIDALKNLIRVEESSCDVFVYVGYIRICAMYEEDDRWYIEIDGKELLSMFGYESKQAAMDAIVKHLTD
jgi:hypothetical protein